MKRALRLARRGLGRTSPNPPVGAVLVRDERLVGEGYHAMAGGAHAEVEALSKAGEMAARGTLYVTLEPCVHHGRTSPCTDTILAARVTRVVAAVRDPNPMVNGRGIARLRDAGISVLEGICGEEARELAEAFFKFITTGLPFVTLKWAMSLDGKIAAASGHSQWVSGEKSRRFVQRLRQAHDAVMVGIKTVLRDDPRLTVRGRGTPGRRVVPRQPRRIILDPDGIIPLDRQIVTAPLEAPTMVVTCREPPPDRRSALEARGVEVRLTPSKNGRPVLRPLLDGLGKEGVLSILVEGGGGVNAWVLEERLADKVYAFVAPKIVGGKEAKTPVEGVGAATMAEALLLSRVRWERVGEDLLVKGYLS